MGIKIKKVFYIGIIIALILGGTGCKSSVIVQSQNEESYVLKVENNLVSMADLKTVLLEYKEVYNQYHMEIDSSAIWEETNEHHITYEEQLLKDYVLDELVILEILQIIGAENNIALSQEEETKVLEAATAYMACLNEASKEYCYATQEQAANLMKKYQIAEKTIEMLVVSENWEISENEARAIHVQIMEFSEEAAARNAFAQLQQGESFQQVYFNMLGENPKDYTVVRGSLIQVLEDAVYHLKTGEYTEVLGVKNEETGEMGYFILYCAKDYIEELTKNNIEEIQNAKKTAYWMPIVQAKRNQLSLYLDRNMLKKEDFSYEHDIEAHFFNIYNQYFGEANE